MTMLGHQGILAAVAGGVTKGKTIFGSGIANGTLGVAAGASRIGGLGTTAFPSSTGAAYGNPVAGTYTDAGVAWTANSTSGGSGVFVNLINNSGSLNLALTIPSGAGAGRLYSTGSSSGTAGEWAFYGGQSGGALSVRGVAANFAGTSIHAQVLGNATTSSFGTPSVTRYLAPVGATSWGTVQSQNEIKASFAGTIAGWSIYAPTNTRPSTTTLNLTVNGATVSTISVLASTPGSYSGGGGTFNAGDLIGITQVTGAGAGNLLPSSMVVVLGNPTAAISDVWAQIPFGYGTNGVVVYGPIVGTFNSNTYPTESYNDWALKFNAILRTPQIYVFTNTATADVVFTLRVNGANTGVTVTVPALTTGWITGTGEVTVAASDLIAWHSLKSSGTGTMTPLRIGLQVEYLSG